MAKPIAYRVIVSIDAMVSADALADLEAKVDRELDAGAECVGGVVYFSDTSGYTFMQAMVVPLDNRPVGEEDDDDHS